MGYTFAMVAAPATSLEKSNMCNYEASCEKKIFGRGMCSQHYFRVLRAEKREIEGPKDRKYTPPDIFDGLDVDYEDFWQFVKKEVGIE